MSHDRHGILHICVTLLLISTVGIVPSASAEDLSPDELQFFEQQVRPLLVKRCFECHSTGAKTVEGGLLLDSRDGWETGGDSGAAVEPGNVAGSLLIAAVRYDDLEMPPAGKLPAEEIAILERWVEMGAPDPRAGPVGRTTGLTDGIDWTQARSRWAFQPPQRHAPPAVERHDWPRDDIDRFVLARIEAAGLVPAQDAERRTWLRRVTFDLTGLPPSPADIEAFLADDTATAPARAVDRLLTSTAFGEQWGRHWLDVARYADTNGGDFNATFKTAWRYRDYIIAAFNNDKPFNQLIREQLAGDLLPSDTSDERAERLIATGFLMVGCKMLSERDKDKFRMDVVDEQLDTVGRAFLGLTLGCARCHDHKFDPLPTADYYALAGIFQSTESYRGESQKYVSAWKDVELPVPPAVKAAVDAHQQRTEELRASIKRLERLRQTVADQLQQLDSGLQGIIVDDSQAKRTGEWKASTNSPLYFGEGYIHNDKHGLGEKSVTYVPTLPAAGSYEVRMSFAGSDGRATNVPVVIVHADGEARLSVDQTKVAPIDKLWLSLGTFQFAAGMAGSVTIRTDDTDGFVLADAVQFLPQGETTLAKSDDDAKSDPDAPVAENPDSNAKEATMVVKLRAAAEEFVGKLAALKQELQEHEASAPPPLPTCMAVREHKEIADASIRIRGEVHRAGEIIPRGFLTILSDGERRQLTDTSQSGRLELADWIAAEQNPLTARVIVNRVWQHLFGRGIVPTVDNFGTLGEAPTHPELLDTLAVEFMEDGWSLKRLIRRLVLTRTYALSATPVTRDDSVDPQNDLLTHFRRRRVTAEALRDAMLVVSGQLDRTPGGSAVEPLEYLAIATSGAKSADLKVAENVRRSVYLPMVRNDLPEILRLFDVADPELVTGRRAVTNVPAQALFLMNSPFVTRAADQTAARVLANADDPNASLAHVYELLYARPPTPPEREQALTFLQSQATAEPIVRLGRLIHVLLAATEFRMLD